MKTQTHGTARTVVEMRANALGGARMPRTAMRLSAEKLRELARAGAGDALRPLRAEIVAIERTFPELALPKRRRALRRSLKEASSNTRRMSAAARRTISLRMKRYWAERRRAKEKIK